MRIPMDEPREPDAPATTETPGSRTPVIVFAVALLSLSIVGLASLSPPRILTGMPDDPDLRRLPEILRLPPNAHGDLRFQSSFVSSAGPREDGGPSAAELAEAERILREARRRHPRDPRLFAALGSYDLALERLERAERHYRRAIERAGDYGEARLGLGVTLADRARAVGDEDAARRLQLAAIAQLAAVDERDPVYLPALFNRALLLLRVGHRDDEARRWAGLYAALDPGPWSDQLTRELSKLPPTRR
jgi:tetratricopeptide (TPR) repeat protein